MFLVFLTFAKNLSSTGIFFLLYLLNHSLAHAFEQFLRNICID